MGKGDRQKAKPSSAARAAELLGHAGSSAAFGFGGCGCLLFYKGDVSCAAALAACWQRSLVSKYEYGITRELFWQLSWSDNSAQQRICQCGGAHQ